MPANVRLSTGEKIALNSLHYQKWRSAFDLDIGLPMLKGLVNKGQAEMTKSVGFLQSPLTELKFRRVDPDKAKKKRVIKRSTKITNAEAYAIADKLLGNEPKRRKLKRRKKS